MDLINLSKGCDEEQLPFSKHTLYRWSSTNKYPNLILKISGKLFFDHDEWLKMAAETRLKKKKP
jgi:hypothetical protein